MEAATMMRHDQAVRTMAGMVNLRGVGSLSLATGNPVKEFPVSGVRASRGPVDELGNGDPPPLILWGEE